MSKNVLKNAVISIVLFFGLLMIIGYINAGYEGMKGTLTDPFNWIIIIIVIVASTAYRRFRGKGGDTADEDEA